MNKFFKKLTKQLWQAVEILAAILAIGLLVSSLFGPDVPFFGGVTENAKSVIDSIGSAGLGVIVAILILKDIWKRQ